jgi:hypothetical protein
MLPGCIVDIPPEPIMKNPEEIAVPLAELPAYDEAPGKELIKA